MCLFLYIGSDLPLPLELPRDGETCLVPAEPRPAMMKHFAHVAMLVDCHGSKTYCSCVFYEDSLPWDPCEEDPRTVRAFEKFAAIVTRLRADARNIEVVAMEDHIVTNERGEISGGRLRWHLATSDLRLGHQLFQGGQHMNGGIPPDEFTFRFDESLSAPVPKALQNGRPT